MRSALLFAVLSFALAVLIGCDTAVQPPIPDPPDSLAVYSAVTAWDSTQYAVVATPRPADQRQLAYVTGATASINNHPLSVIPRDSAFGGGYGVHTPPGEWKANYVTDSLYIEPGSTARLHVVHDGREVTGIAQVPGAFRATVDSLTLRWQKSRGAALYRIRIERFSESRESEVWIYSATTRDTTHTIEPSEGRGAEPFKPGSHIVRIAAVDSNLVGYTDRDARRSGIEGGFGFFGAVTRIGGTIPLPATNTAKASSEKPPLRPPQP